MSDTSDSLLKQNKLTLRVATYGGFAVQRENQNYKNYDGNFGGRVVKYIIWNLRKHCHKTTVC